MLANLTKMNAKQIVQSDTTVYDPPLKFLQVFPLPAGGVLVVKNALDETITYTIPPVTTSGGLTPFIIPGLIRQVMDTDTTVTDAAMVGYR